jgi:hypothetical protein
MSQTIPNILNFAGPDMIESFSSFCSCLERRSCLNSPEGWAKRQKSLVRPAMRWSENSVSPAPMSSDQPKRIYEKSEPQSAR